jgi:alcohol dehydrogenase (NADP+)
VHVTAYSPLGSPDSASLLQRQAPVLLQDPVVLQVAQELGRSPAQVLIRWGC